MEDHFEQGIRIIRDAYQKRLAMKDAEVMHLKSESQKKDTEIKNSQLRISQLEMQLSRADKRIAELSRSAQKLASFKQSVLQSFAEEDLEDVRDRVLNGTKGSDAVEDILERVKGFRLGSEESLQANGYQDNVGVQQSTSGVVDKRPALEHLESGSIPSFLPPPPKYTSPSPPTRYSEPAPAPIPNTSSNWPSGYDGSAGTPPTSIDDGAKSTSTVDGREFFRTARSVLSYDEFTQLLTNVKAYNNREQSRHRTVENVRQLVASKHRDVFEQFQRLLGVGAAGR
ncbi:hypothetical protein M427DRAFT_59016 [Gonapodya prolifera JEL478]|uniref:At4g15545-like C-terminal domain-containing protein n=1 Tax=Gonapodya prolifera (strain JEL478) TaxID=1344416 RepID=A0A139A8J4_GONPJ|nr:hypothetical protein M427DRAFT_59016 [Gonapodya prolifera JEL478]|eukprot:KXS13121.1 hypothetical protein M427DRAFT_59016 [Gonapodya prolifera JEL478]